LSEISWSGREEERRADEKEHVGEISAINNCSEILTDPEGEYKLSPPEALAEFRKLSLYTNAEPCAMVLPPPPTSHLSFPSNYQCHLTTT
jgi:tRNA(Arg) A34 adenosine deaminase TadA